MQLLPWTALNCLYFSSRCFFCHHLLLFVCSVSQPDSQIVSMIGCTELSWLEWIFTATIRWNAATEGYWNNPVHIWQLALSDQTVVDYNCVYLLVTTTYSNSFIIIWLVEQEVIKEQNGRFAHFSFIDAAFLFRLAQHNPFVHLFGTYTSVQSQFSVCLLFWLNRKHSLHLPYNFYISYIFLFFYKTSPHANRVEMILLFIPLFSHFWWEKACVPGLYHSSGDSLHRHLPHTEQEVEISRAGGKKILTSSSWRLQVDYAPTLSCLCADVCSCLCVCSFLRRHWPCSHFALLQ